MSRDRDYEARREVNDESRNHAGHHGEPWSGYEIDLLLQWDGSESELLDLAEMLGRTVEACRQRFYEARSGKVRDPRATARRTRSVTRTVTTTTRVVWDDEDEWPDWYVRG